MKYLVFFLDDNLLAPNQSGFKLCDSCINQSVSITDEIYSSLMMDLKLEVFSWIYIKPLIKFSMRGLYLNLSKTVFQMTC